MRVKRRILSLVVISLFFIVQAFTCVGSFVKAESNVQVEVVVQSNTGEIARGTSSSLQASTALNQVLNNSGLASAVVTGGMISSINGISNAGDYSKYWYTAINRNNSYVDVNDGINSLMLQNGDKYIVYYSAPSTYTANKIDYSTTSPNKKLTITLNNVQLDWLSGNPVTNPIQSSTMKAWVDGNPVSMNNNKIVLDNGLPVGRHSLKINDYQTNPSLMPKVVEDTFYFYIKNPTCNVRVEGLNDTIVQGKATGENAMAIVKNVLEANTIHYTYNSNYGGYITEINGLAEKQISTSTGWMFYVKNSSSIISPDTGLGYYIPDENDEIVMYFSDYTVPFVNSISFNPNVVTENSQFKMKFSYSYTDWSDWTNPVSKEKAISGALVTIDKTNYATDSNGEINIVGGLEKGIHTYKISGYNSEKLSTVIMDQGTFNIDGVHSPSFNYSKSSFYSNIDKDNLLINKNIPVEIKSVSSVVKNYSDPWAYVSLNKLGISKNENYLKESYSDIKKYGVKDYSNTELEKLIFALTACGYTPYNFNGNNLVDELYNRDINTFLINDVIYGLLAMNYADISDNYNIKRENLKQKLLDSKVGSGNDIGWSLGTTIDADVTGSALCALAPYLNEPMVNSVANSAVKSLAYHENESGYVVGHYGVSCETNSFVILGLVSLGINPEGITTLNDNSTVNFGKSKGDLVSALLSFKAGGGTYRHTLDGGGNSIATEECLRALISINEYKKSGKAYNYYSSKINTQNFKVYSSFVSEGTVENKGKNSVTPLSNASSVVVAAAGTDNIITSKKTSKTNNKTIKSQNTIYLIIGGLLIAVGVLGVGFQVLSKKEE